MKLWPFVVVLVGLVLAGTVHIMVREPQRGALNRAGRELPRLPVERVETPLPPRFAGPLPTRVEDFHQELEKGPPLSYVRSRLLEGDQAMGERFLSALRQAAASARSLDELWSTYGVALGLGERHEDRPPDDMMFPTGIYDEDVPCEWLRARLSERDEENPLLRELFWRKLVRCPGAKTEAVFAREYAPVEWVLQHHSLFGARRFTPALERAVRRILEEDRQELFQLAEVYVSFSQEPVPRALREELWRRASGEVAARMREHAEWSAREDRKAQEHPLKCPPIPTRPEGTDALTLNQCLGRWALSNWAEAARFAMSASRSPELLNVGQAQLATLRNFPSLEALRTWARQRGLLPESIPPDSIPMWGGDPENPSLGLGRMMREAKRDFAIELTDYSFPRPHDELLMTLAWTVRPELAGVAFEQLPPRSLPRPWGEEPSSEEYTLRAYADGQRFSVKAQNSYSVLDLGAVIGLLNQVLETRGSSIRFALLDTDFHVVAVVLGPEASLREADALGLFRLGDGREVLRQVETRQEKTVRRMLGE